MPKPIPLMFTESKPVPKGVDMGRLPPTRIDLTRPACEFCDDNEANILAIECGHVIGCMDCVLKLAGNECPFCRAEIGSVMQIYN